MTDDHRRVESSFTPSATSSEWVVPRRIDWGRYRPGPAEAYARRTRPEGTTGPRARSPWAAGGGPAGVVGARGPGPGRAEPGRADASRGEPAGAGGGETSGGGGGGGGVGAGRRAAGAGARR